MAEPTEPTPTMSRRDFLKGVVVVGVGVGAAYAASRFGIKLPDLGQPEQTIVPEVQQQLSTIQTAIDGVCKKGMFNLTALLGKTVYDKNTFQQLIQAYEGGMGMGFSFSNGSAQPTEAGKTQDVHIDLTKVGDAYKLRYIAFFPGPNGTINHVDLPKDVELQPASSQDYPALLQGAKELVPPMVDSLFLFHPDTYMELSDPSKPKPPGSSLPDMPYIKADAILDGIAAPEGNPDDRYSFYFDSIGRFAIEKMAW